MIFVLSNRSYPSKCSTTGTNMSSKFSNQLWDLRFRLSASAQRIFNQTESLILFFCCKWCVTKSYAAFVESSSFLEAILSH